ncbi:MAG TPA: TonB family protein [Polyangia bacterium]|jgi:TonB family protein|nr:TonB family protein [Polyangia bacterium]
MNYPIRLLVCAVVAVVGHLLLIGGAIHLPPRAEAARPVVVQVLLKVPPPEPEKPPEPEATPEAQPAHQAPPRRRAMSEAPRRENPPKNPPPTERPATGTDTTTTPVFGISMESTSSAGTGPALPVGNTLQTKPGRTKTAPSEVKPLAAPAQAYEVTKMPVPIGDCRGNYYTEEAKQAGVEGTVILKVLVGEDGRVRDVKIVQGLPHGLTEAAVRAIKACRYTIGEKDGKPVPVWVPGRIRFVLAEAE